MAYVISRLCQDCVDSACASVCPAEAIVKLRLPGSIANLPNQLFINPDDCIDCDMCVPECPWEAVFRDDDLPNIFSEDLRLNAITVQRRADFEPATVVKSRKPSDEEVHANKVRWGLVKAG